MGNFQKGNNRGGGFRGGNGGGRPNFGGNRGDRREVSMHKAVCDQCHKSCEVPFRPSSDKPIYCNDCFSSKRGNEDRAPRKEFNDRGPKREFNDRPTSFSKPAPSQEDVKFLLKDMNAKLDLLVSAIEKLNTSKTPTMVVTPKINKTTVAKKVEVKKVAKTPAKKAVKKSTKKAK